ncbi:MAG TPA: Ppx/GppA phosphatase family protein [Mariprofundaceae bacterium]|nr:Ppx/GppA phosphatase family protein [Mariprofundaceae bacterium]
MQQGFAAIDIGSNTLRLLIAEPSAGRDKTHWHQLAYDHYITRLGEGLHTEGRLGETGMARALEGLQQFAHRITEYGIAPECVNAVATAAMREAKNGQTFLDRIGQETGITPHIISGNEEAATCLAGAASVLDEQTRRDMLLFDIGGGSTEFIRAGNGLMRDAISRKLGVVRLVEAHLHSDPPSTADYRAMIDTAKQHLEQVASFWKDAKPPSHLVGTAGTITTLAAIHLELVPYDAERVNNHVMLIEDVHMLRDHLLSMSHEQRTAIPAIEPGRADLIIAGLAIVEAVMRRWHYDRLVTVDAGLLEGAWLQAAASESRKVE